MIPIQDLLSRIRWDAEFGQAEFEIGFYDRVQNSIIVMPLRDIFFVRDDHFAFRFTGEQGAIHSVPLHRIREVYRNGELIWQRHPEGELSHQPKDPDHCE